MQKWEKQLIIILFILAVGGVFIGLSLSNSGIGELKVLADIDLFGLTELILSGIAVICTIFDIYETYESKKLLGTVKFKVKINTRKRLRNILVLIGLGIFFELGIFLGSKDMHILPLCFITLMLALMLVLHNGVSDGISESGILYCGIYHGWEDIKSHNFINETILEINVVNIFFVFEYMNVLKFVFEEMDKEEIEKLLAEKICITDESNAL